MPTSEPAVVYAPDGIERSCHFKIISGKYHYWNDYSELDELQVTLRRAGSHFSHTRKLRIYRGWEPESVNADRMDKWHPLTVSQWEEYYKEGKRDPAYLITRYRNQLDCLEVLASPDMRGKWMLRAIPWEKQEALSEAKRAAGADAYNARRKRLEQADQEAAAFAQSVYRRAPQPTQAKASTTAATRAKSSSQDRRLSSGSLASNSSRKGPRTSSTAIATDQVSMTSNANNNAGGRSRARLLRQGLSYSNGQTPRM